MSEKIALATIALNNMAGGIERNIVYLANHLANTEREVFLISLDQEDAVSFFEIDPRITWIKVGKTQPHTAISFRARCAQIALIRQKLRANDIDQLICFTHGILVRFLAAAAGLGIRTICSERNALEMYRFISTRKWNANFLALAFVDKIVVQFDTYREDYPIWTRHKVRVVNNPVPRASTQTKLSHKTILSVGRLATQKQFDLLIRAFAIIHNQHPDWQLVIIGEGKLQQELVSLISNLHLTKKAKVIAPQKNMSESFVKATIYAQPSKWEGFPNALAEALAHGLIGVGFANTRGVSNLILDGYNGVLAKGTYSPDRLAQSLITVIQQQDQWLTMSTRSRKISDRYSYERWQEQWFDVLEM